MEAISQVETPFGPIQFRGRDTGRPVLLMILGAFAKEDVLEGFQAAIPEADVWRAHLPGNHCPPLIQTSIGLFIRAFEHAIETHASGRNITALGLSVGGIVALGLRTPAVRRILSVEPVLRTGNVWPFKHFRDGQFPDWEAFTWPILGVDRDRFVGRCYLHLLDNLDRPALVLLGGVPLLPERALPIQPSMVDDDVREALRAHRRVELREFPAAGHNIPRQQTGELLDAIARSLKASAAMGS